MLDSVEGNLFSYFSQHQEAPVNVVLFGCDLII